MGKTFEYPDPTSYMALELMGMGIPERELDRLAEKAHVFQALSGIRDQSFSDGMLRSLAEDGIGKTAAEQADNVFSYMKTLRILMDSKGGYCPEAIQLRSFFEPLVQKIMAYETKSGKNAFIGDMGEDRLRAYFCRASAWIAGKWEDPWSRDMALKHAAKLVYAVTADCMNRYYEKHMTTPDARKRMLEKLGRGQYDFPVELRKDISEAAKSLAETAKALFDEYRKTQPAFCMGENGYETWDHDVAGVLSMLGEDSSAGYAALGVRKHGYEGFLKRCSEVAFMLNDREIPKKKRTAISARLASGNGESLDPDWLAHVDKKNPFSYNIPARDQGKLKMKGLAIKVLAEKMDTAKLGREIRDMVKENELLGNLGAGRGDLTLSVFCMIGRGLAARERYGEEEEAWEAYEKLKEIVCEKDLSAPAFS